MSITCAELLIEYLRHYNTARPHRALGQLAPAQADTRPPEPINLAEHRIHRKQVLGGLTHEYYVAALPPPHRWNPQVTTPNRISEPHRLETTFGKIPVVMWWARSYMPLRTVIHRGVIIW